MDEHVPQKTEADDKSRFLATVAGSVAAFAVYFEEPDAHGTQKVHYCAYNVTPLMVPSVMTAACAYNARILSVYNEKLAELEGKRGALRSSLDTSITLIKKISESLALATQNDSAVMLAQTLDGYLESVQAMLSSLDAEIGG